MTSETRPSGQILAAIWKAFQARYSAEQGGPSSSMRQVSAVWLASDPQSLAHWTNDAGHAKYPAWRIPLKRIPEVCVLLEASVDDRDALMWARLRETQAHDKCADVMVVLDWLAPTIAELAAEPSLDALEKEVLEAFRRVKKGHPLTDHGPGPGQLGLLDLLETGFENWLIPALNAYVDEQMAYAGDDAQVDLTDAKRKMLEALNANRRQQRAARKKVTRRERRTTIDELRKAFRQSQARVVGNAI